MIDEMDSILTSMWNGDFEHDAEWSLNNAKDQIYKAVMEVIGEDVQPDGLRHPDEDEWHNTRNKLRQTQRQRANKFFGRN